MSHAVDDAPISCVALENPSGHLRKDESAKGILILKCLITQTPEMASGTSGVHSHTPRITGQDLQRWN